MTINLATGYTFAIDTLMFEIGGPPVPATSTLDLTGLGLFLLTARERLIHRRGAAH